MRIEIKGADQALKALRVMEPETAKHVSREVSDIGKSLAGAIRAGAPSDAPMSGWKQTSGARGARNGSGWPAWSAVSATSRRRGLSTIVTTQSAPAMIAVVYESAGIKGGRSDNGRRFIANIERSGTLVKSGKWSGRLARRAVAQDYPRIIRGIEDACQRAVDRVNRLMP